jgi:hypothetical protein
MEDGMNVPGCGEVEFGSYRGDKFCNDEGAITFGRQFDRSVRYGEVLPFQPDTLPLGIFAGEWRVGRCSFIQGQDGHEAVLLEFHYVVLSFLIRSGRGLIRRERWFPT